MSELLGIAYPWIKAFHIFSVISWMAAMLYLPRLFVYHCAAPAGSAQSETFKVMEHRLIRIIMTPAMIATWLFGLLLIATPGIVDWSAAYMWVKLTLVLALSGLHGFLVATARQFALGRNARPQRFYRILNEVPAVATLLIVILIVVRPF